MRFEGTKNLDDLLKKAKDNSLSELTDTSIPGKIVDFLKKNPFPQDHKQWHKFAEDDLGVDSEVLEQYAYAMLTVILTGGKSKGDTSKISKEQLDTGLKIESEHVELEGINNKVIKEIQEIFATKISADHDSEDKEYYENTLFTEELKKEGK